MTTHLISIAITPYFVEDQMLIRALPSLLAASLVLMASCHAASAAESDAPAAPPKASKAVASQAATGGSNVVPAQGVTKARTKSNNANDAAPATTGDTANRPGDGNPQKQKTKSNIKND